MCSCKFVYDDLPILVQADLTEATLHFRIKMIMILRQYVLIGGYYHTILHAGIRFPQEL